MRWVGWRIAVVAAGLGAVLACTPTPGAPAGPGHPDLSVSQGTIGAPCTSNDECTSGVCFAQNFFNDTTKVTSPGGYCSRTCTTDAECEGASCVAFGSSGSLCLAKCTQPSDCRTGYACWQFSPNVCFSSFNLNCDPTAGQGTCTATGLTGTGGCLRASLGPAGFKSGICRQGCSAGAGHCATPMGGGPQECLVFNTTQNIDGTITGDKFRGAVCQAQVSSPPPVRDGVECLYPNAAGTMTHFFDVCVDGDECYLNGSETPGTGFDGNGDDICHKLCNPVSGPGCPSGTCHDVWGLFSSANPIGLCLP